MGGDGFQMSKFFIEKESISGDSIDITGEDVAHIRKVLRMRVGEKLIACDNDGTDFECEITNIDDKHVAAKILTSWKSENEAPIRVTLFQGIPKSDKMDFIIQKCVELGIDSIVPVKTDRTVIRFENTKDEVKKQQRWQKIAVEAAKQCNRGILPKITNPVDFNTALDMAGANDLILIPYENESEQGLKSVLRNNSTARTIAVFIGPEGGFAEDEVKNCIERSFYSVSLGKRILRTETAGLTVLSILMYELGDVG